MLKKEYFKMQNFNYPKSRYSKQVNLVKNKLGEIGPLLRTKTLHKRMLVNDIELTKSDVYELFNKASSARTDQEVQIFAKYLSQKYDYFKKLKNEDSQMKVENLIKIGQLEKYHKGDSIIRYGEIGDKFYIVLDGIVEIFKPKYIEVEIYPNEFINFLNKIKEKEGNILKYERIREKNRSFLENYSNIHKEIKEIKNKKKQDGKNSKRSRSSIIASNSVDEFNKHKQIFIIENEEKMGEYGEGFSFGDISLIKNTVRNATIKAKEDCILLTFEKNDTNKTMFDYQKKKLSREIDTFTKTYSFFKDFSHDKVLSLFNCISKKTIYKGEYLYEQNKKDDFLYIINNGIFSITCKVSFFLLNDFIEYINYKNKNVIEYIINNRECKFSDLMNLIQICDTKIEDKEDCIKNNEFQLWNKMNDKIKKDNLYHLKKDEEKLNDPEQLYTLNIKKIRNEEILGIEEIFDFKKRFCSCKCISDKADIKYINLKDFLKLIIYLGEDQLKYLLKIVNERKKLLTNQIINAIKVKEREIKNEFDNRYESLIKDEGDKKIDKENKSNQIFSTLKLKGIKNSLKDILDNNISILDSNDNDNNKDESVKMVKVRKLKKNKSQEALLKSFYSKRKQNDIVKLKIIKNIVDKRKIYSENSIVDMPRNSGLYIQNYSSNTSKYIFSRNIKNIRNSNSYANMSKTMESFTTKFQKGGINSYSKDKSAKTIKDKIENDKLNLNLEKSETISNYSNIKNIKINSRIFNISQKLEKRRNSKYSDKQISEGCVIINLPNLYEKKKMRKSQSDFKNISNERNSNYREFYHFYDYDKNFYLGGGFTKKLKNRLNFFEKKYKIESVKNYK